MIRCMQMIVPGRRQYKPVIERRLMSRETKPWPECSHCPDRLDRFDRSEGPDYRCRPVSGGCHPARVNPTVSGKGHRSEFGVEPMTVLYAVLSFATEGE